MSTQETTRPVQSSATPDLVVVRNPESPTAQAYRAVRASVRNAQGATPVRSVLLADAGSRDQTGDAAANLAASFALSGDRTVLVDVDTANPVQHSLLNVPRSPGLVDWLAEDAGSAEPQPLETPIPDLLVLPAGTAALDGNRAPADLLTPEACARLTGSLGDRARFVLFHAAMARTSSEALTVAAHVDAVLVLVRSGVTKRSDAQRAKESLERVGARLLGVVLTDSR